MTLSNSISFFFIYEIKFKKGSEPNETWSIYLESISLDFLLNYERNLTRAKLIRAKNKILKNLNFEIVKKDSFI